MTDKLRWGFLGTARINNAILNALPASSRGEAYAVASRDPQRAEAYAREKNLPRWHAGYEHLLADPQVDVVYISLPNQLHAEWTLKALQAGKHVLCEKPFALTPAEVDAAFAAARQAGRVVAEAFMYRHHPKILKAKALIDEGALGEVHFMHASFSFTLTRPNDIRWKPEMGGGALWDVGCYPVSLARYLFGAPQAVDGWQVSAPSGVDESFAGTLYFSGGRAAQLDCSFRMPNRQRAEVVGSDGVLTLTHPFRPDVDGSRLLLRRGEGEEEIAVDNPDRYLLEIEDLHEAVLNGRPPRITPAETRGTVETIGALYRAAQAGPGGPRP